jgi:hypothetical protein
MRRLSCLCVSQEDEEAADAGEQGMLPAPSIGDRERQDSANSLDAAVRLASEQRYSTQHRVVPTSCWKLVTVAEAGLAGPSSRGGQER